VRDRICITVHGLNPVKVARAKELRRTMTLAERVFWEAVRRRGIGGFHFRRQQVIERFIVDFYCHTAGVVVEVDGAIHDKTRDYDNERDRVLANLGLRVVRFSNDRVLTDLPAVLEIVCGICRSRVGTR